MTEEKRTIKIHKAGVFEMSPREIELVLYLLEADKEIVAPQCTFTSTDGDIPKESLWNFLGSQAKNSDCEIFVYSSDRLPTAEECQVFVSNFMSKICIPLVLISWVNKKEEGSITRVSL